MKKLLANEMKTGLVVVIAILIGIFYYSKTTHFKPSETYRLKARFNEAGGLKQNAIVSVAGVEVGRVESINFIYEPENTKIETVLVLDKKAKVREDSIAFIGSTGIIGDPFLGITPGNSSVFLKDGSSLVSEDPLEMRKLMKQADEIAKKLDIILGEAKTVVADNKGKLNDIVTNLEETTANFKDFSADIKAHPWKLLMKGKEK